MQTSDRFELEEQLLNLLSEDQRDTWLEFSPSLQRALLLAAGFMDVELCARIIREIHDLRST